MAIKILIGIRRIAVQFPLLIFVIFSFLIYLPVLSKGFSADDFMVMKRVGLDGVLLEGNFFRPLSDLTLYLNFLIAGMHTFIYNATNILLHALTSFFLFRFCYSITKNYLEHFNESFAWCSGLLLLCFPFHNETVVWIVGRASSLAAFFGMISLYVAISFKPKFSTACIAGFSYLLGLSAYESIFTIPAIALCFAFFLKKPKAYLYSLIVAYSLFLAIHVTLRISLSHGVLGSYGTGVFDMSLKNYLEHFLKMFARMFIPPIDNSFSFVVVTVLFFCSSITIMYLLMKNRKDRNRVLAIAIFLTGMIFLSMIVGILFPVSTRTSEGDRLLYFPSIFVCLLLSYSLHELITSKKMRAGSIGICFLFYMICLQTNNFNWLKADKITKGILNEIGSTIQKKQTHLFFCIPAEHKGAYVFRNGFYDALLIKGIDTTGVRLVNVLNYKEYRLLPSTIEPKISNDTLYLANTVVIAKDSIQVVEDAFYSEKIDRKTAAAAKAWYWNGNALVPLKLDHHKVF